MEPAATPAMAEVQEAHASTASASLNLGPFAEAHLQQLPFAKYTDRLLGAWEEIGESAESQKHYLVELSKSITAQLDAAVEGALQRKLDIENLVQRKAENIADLKGELRSAIDTNLPVFTMPSSKLCLIERLSAMETIEVKLTTERKRWVTILSDKRDRALGMCQILGMQFDETLREPSPLTPDRSEAYDKYIEFLGQTQVERKQLIAEMKSSIMQYWSVLESTPTSHLEKSIADETCDLGVHAEVVEALQQMKSDLNVEYQNREAETAELGAEIQHLWDLLQIDPKFQQYFSEKNGGIGLRAVEACRDERQRLLIKKEKLLPRIIHLERQKIEQLFEQTSCDIDNQHKLFAAYHNPPEHLTEEYLRTLKDYTLKLEQRLEGLKPILARIERRAVLVDERIQYEKIVSDPNRLTSRRGGLSHLKENEMRIRVEKKLPKLEAHITEMVTKWEAENDCTLLVNGKSYLVRACVRA